MDEKVNKMNSPSTNVSVLSENIKVPHRELGKIILEEVFSQKKLGVSHFNILVAYIISMYQMGSVPSWIKLHKGDTLLGIAKPLRHIRSMFLVVGRL